MLAIPYLLLSFLAGLVLVQRFFREFPVLVRMVAAFAISVVLTGWVTFLAGWLIHSMGRDDATFSGAFVAMLVNAVIATVLWRELRPASFRVRPLELLGTGAALALSFWVMHQRLSSDPLKVSGHTWGDTALHIGIARSFSQGDNYPPVLPIFAGQPIRYHFGFDFYVGVLERLGLPTAWAFNLPGALGFAAIMVLVFAIVHHLWRRVSIAIVAVILFATNSSLAFLRYFDRYPSAFEALKPGNWWQHDTYLAGGGYQPGEQIALFWTLNHAYLTQTHLIISTVVVLFVGYAVLRHVRPTGGAEDQPLRWPRAVALGLLSGAAFWLNGILFVVSMIFLCVLFYVHRDRPRHMALPSAILIAVPLTVFVVGSFVASDGIRKVALALLLGSLVLLGPIRRSLPFFVPAGALALPQIIWFTGGVGTKDSLGFHNGYLVENFRFQNPGSYLDFADYWWLNLGLAGPLVILAAAVIRSADRKVLVAVMSIFVFGNLVRLGVDVGGHNHKVFNLWEVLLIPFVAYGLVWVSRTLWNGLPGARRRLGLVGGRVLAAVIVPAAFVVLVLSGLLDFMTLKNDYSRYTIGDTPALGWIEGHTSRNAVFLTAFGDPYTVPTLAGRAVYVGGFSTWAPQMGYDTESRQKVMVSIYSAPDRATACARLRGTGVDYIQVSSSEMQASRFPLNAELFRSEFVLAFSDGSISYYDVNASCGSAGVPAPNGR